LPERSFKQVMGRGGPARTLIGLIEKGSNAIGIKPPVTQAIIDKYTEDIAVDGNLIQKELGFVP